MSNIDNKKFKVVQHLKKVIFKFKFNYFYLLNIIKNIGLCALCLDHLLI